MGLGRGQGLALPFERICECILEPPHWPIEPHRELECLGRLPQSPSHTPSPGTQAPLQDCRALGRESEGFTVWQTRVEILAWEPTYSLCDHGQVPYLL